MVLSEGSRVLRTETENPIVPGLQSSYEVRSFASRQLDFLPHLLYTFQDVSSFHSNAVSEVAAASNTGRLLNCEIDPLDHFKRL